MSVSLCLCPTVGKGLPNSASTAYLKAIELFSGLATQSRPMANQFRSRRTDPLVLTNRWQRPVRFVDAGWMEVSSLGPAQVF